MATVSLTPARTMFRTPLRRRSWKIAPERPAALQALRPRHSEVADLVPDPAAGVDEDPAEHAPKPDLERVHLREVLAELGDEVGGEVGAARVPVLRLLEREGAGLEVDVPALEGEDFPAPPRQRAGDAAAQGHHRIQMLDDRLEVSASGPTMGFDGLLFVLSAS